MSFIKYCVIPVFCIALFVFVVWGISNIITKNSQSIRDVRIGPIGITTNQLAAEKAACEENIPRNQECKFVYTFIPPDEALVENE